MKQSGFKRFHVQFQGKVRLVYSYTSACVCLCLSACNQVSSSIPKADPNKMWLIRRASECICMLGLLCCQRRDESGKERGVGEKREGRDMSLLESPRGWLTPRSFSWNGDVITLAAKRVYSQLVQFRHANGGFQCAVLPGGIGQKAQEICKD